MCALLASRAIDYMRWPERHLLQEKSKEFEFPDAIGAILLQYLKILTPNFVPKLTCFISRFN